MNASAVAGAAVEGLKLESLNRLQVCGGIFLLVLLVMGRPRTLGLTRGWCVWWWWWWCVCVFGEGGMGGGQLQYLLACVRDVANTMNASAVAGAAVEGLKLESLNRLQVCAVDT